MMELNTRCASCCFADAATGWSPGRKSFQQVIKYRGQSPAALLFRNILLFKMVSGFVINSILPPMKSMDNFDPASETY